MTRTASRLSWLLPALLIACSASADGLPPPPPFGLGAEKRVTVASCTSDKVYGDRMAADLAKRIEESGSGVRARASPRLPSNWSVIVKSFLWDPFEPALVVIHFSCFEPSGKESIEERNRNFMEFLDSLKTDRSKILVFSRAFQTSSEYLPNLIRSRQFCPGYRDRLFTLAVSGNDLPGMTEKGTNDLVTAVLGILKEPPTSPAAKLSCSPK